MDRVLEASIKGFEDASSYNMHRPTYPEHGVEALLKQLRVSGLKGARIIDLGAGTGIFTRMLAGREESFEIVAVEPHDEMRAQLEKRRLINVTVLKGDARAIPAASQEFDAVITAQVRLMYREPMRVMSFDIFYSVLSLVSTTTSRGPSQR